MRTGLLVGHAGRPGTEVDADPGNTLLTLPPGQPVEEGVGRAVSGLTEAAPYRGNRGGAEEEVQLQVRGGFAQIPSPPDLPGEHAVHLGVVQGLQRGVTDLARGVHNAGHRRKFGLHGGEQASDGVRIGDVGRDDTGFAAVLFA